MSIQKAKFYINSAVFNTNSAFLNYGSAVLQLQEVFDDLSEDDKNAIDKLVNALNTIQYAVTTINDTCKSLGVDRTQEHYYNFRNGDLVEVPKSEYAGSPDIGDETPTLIS